MQQFLFYVGFKYGFVYTEFLRYKNLSMTKGKTQLNLFNKILEQLDVNNFNRSAKTYFHFALQDLSFSFGYVSQIEDRRGLMPNHLKFSPGFPGNFPEIFPDNILIFLETFSKC